MIFGLALSLVLVLAPTSALAATAGIKPSEAPTITVGQHYFGNANHWTNSEPPGGSFWRLPPLLTSDVVTVAWNAANTELCLAQEIDDYNWAGNVCNGSGGRGVNTAGGSARTTIQAGTATATGYLEFWGGCCSDSNPYDFTVESIQHAIGVGLNATGEIAPTSTLTGSASLSDGSPVPDGLTFTLDASWASPNKSEHHRSYSAASRGGSLAFPLNLPRSAQGRKVAFSITRAADPQYQEASTGTVEIPVGRLPRGTALARPQVRVRKGKALIRLRCKGNGPCHGVMWLAVRFRQGRHAHKAVIGKARFAVPAGRVRVARVKLNRRGRLLLHHARRHRVRVHLRGRGVKNRRVILRAGGRHGKRHHKHQGSQHHGGSHGGPLTSLDRECTKAGLVAPQITKSVLYYPGQKLHKNSDGNLVSQQVDIEGNHGSMPEECFKGYMRFSQVKTQMQDPNNHKHWVDMRGGVWAPLFCLNCKSKVDLDKASSVYYEDSPTGHETASSGYYYNCTPGPGVTHVRVLIRTRVRKLSNRTIIGEATSKVPIMPVKSHSNSTSAEC